MKQPGPKILKFFQTLNQPPRSPADGTNRRPNPSTHSNPPDRADSTDRAGTIDFTSAQWTLLPITFPEPKSPTIPYAGVRTGEIIGWRYWNVYNDPQTGEQILGSVAHYETWAPGEVKYGNINRLVTNGGMIYPILGGVYSFRDAILVKVEVEDVVRELERYFPDLPIPIYYDFSYTPSLCLGIAIGTVKCWGEVVEHIFGYRAEYAKINSIDNVFGKVSLDDLRRKYLP